MYRTCLFHVPIFEWTEKETRVFLRGFPWVHLKRINGDEKEEGGFLTTNSV